MGGTETFIMESIIPWFIKKKTQKSKFIQSEQVLKSLILFYVRNHTDKSYQTFTEAV